MGMRYLFRMGKASVHGSMSFTSIGDLKWVLLAF